MLLVPDIMISMILIVFERLPANRGVRHAVDEDFKLLPGVLEYAAAGLVGSASKVQFLERLLQGQIRSFESTHRPLKLLQFGLEVAKLRFVLRKFHT